MNITLRRVYEFARGPVAAGLAVWVADVGEDHVWDVGLEVHGLKAAAAVVVVGLVAKLVRVFGDDDTPVRSP